MVAIITGRVPRYTQSVHRARTVASAPSYEPNKANCWCRPTQHDDGRVTDGGRRVSDGSWRAADGGWRLEDPFCWVSLGCCLWGVHEPDGSPSTVRPATVLRVHYAWRSAEHCCVMSCAAPGCSDQLPAGLLTILLLLLLLLCPSTSKAQKKVTVLAQTALVANVVRQMW